MSTHGAPPEYHAAVQSAQPLLNYRFDEPTGNSLNHGSLGAAFDATYTGPVARGVETPGDDTGIGLSPGAYLESLGVSGLTGNPTFSIEVVVRLSSPGAGNLWGPFLHWGNNIGDRTGREVYFGIQNNNNLRLYAGFYNAGVRSVDHEPGNEWLHVVWTRQGGNDSETGSTLYVNGVPVAIQRDTNLTPGYVAAGSINVTASTYRINAGTDFMGSRYFTGTLDELALYDRVLSPLEVADRAALAFCANNSCCLADFNGSGGTPDDADVDAFFVAWNNGETSADINASGGTPDDADVDAFFTRWNAGC
ncbi:MAG: LamG domain-containing protein [Phycisphaerales bacterium]|nr:LamG domain-containing protein [Phycisphaerales bacterium]